MNVITIIVPAALRSFVGGRGQVSVNAMTMRGVLEAFAAQTDNAGTQLIDQHGTLQRFVRIFVDGQPVRSDLDTDVPDGARVTILLALAGG